ncbi:MAG: DUF456 domain-containing protein [Verrucomicrobia bacterium]|nr:MAG: DUF456 domain-containing protein [Verrucomicrobiota bacterium]
MTAVEITGFVLALLAMMVGLLGAVLPGLPGPPIILAAALCHRLFLGPRGSAWWVVGVLAVLAAFSLALDFLATSYGAKRLGATWRGAVGAALGAMAGLFWAPIGLVVGPLLGAMALEMLAGRHWHDAGKAGFGAVLGLVAGIVGKVACCIAMIGLFAGDILYRAFAAR